MKFKNKILIIGYGAVARCALPILLRHIKTPYKNITIIDFVDARKYLKKWIAKGLKYVQERIQPLNMPQEFPK